MLSQSVTAFAGPERIASGDPSRVAAIVAEHQGSGDGRPLLVFDDESGATVDLELQVILRGAAHHPTSAGDADPAVAEAPGRRGPGRPKLGVVAREVTLLPRHWEWLNAQPGGASVALRKLVERARREGGAGDRVRRAQEAAYRFMTAIAGDAPGYEEACRALFARNAEGFAARTATWPEDVREYARGLAAPAFTDAGDGA